ncbi:transcriptional regulator [Pontibacillus halophilus JSM 076056 = DSM 19796]|uniref:Transcriptional regulator n=1 Tax=Pontibacillus halophilus JSM 076056 = DSM 19796 TaxID=1385510 RepID=A0A0A5I9P4_9BACI|nr:PadR family transcriptional regulator [Pontibacillus halophilus]KGX92537.1 transcriptional regulator [Pontibacillus halophilus JSM 076056 = DSM 19796]
MKTNSTKYAILGLITTDCRTGYEIKNLIDRSLNHFWKISFGQIYPTLKTLVEEELATVEYTVQAGKPDKKEYHITELGQQQLQEWLESSEITIPHERNELMLKLFFSRHQPAESAIHKVNEYAVALQEKLATYELIQEEIKSHESVHPDSRYWLITLDYGIRKTRAAIDWCHATVDTLSGS